MNNLYGYRPLSNSRGHPFDRAMSATSPLRNVESAWIKDKNVLIKNNEVTGYKVNMAITFVLEEGERPS